MRAHADAPIPNMAEDVAADLYAVGHNVRCYANKRDTAERPIIDGLIAAGCQVEQLDYPTWRELDEIVRRTYEAYGDKRWMRK